MAANKHPILLVDDESEILFSLRGLLRKEFELHTAESGAEALEILKEHPIHVIMTDQRMPQMSGVQLLRRVQKEHPKTIRIVFTGYADIKAVIDAVNDGHIYRYLTKPWDPDDLLTVLQEACAEFDRQAECDTLLHDLREHLARCQDLLQATLNGQSTPTVEAGNLLLGRIDRVLTSSPPQSTLQNP